ncbi:MAG: tetratricopeptide repeat protein [Planctomycetota bacterium]
MSRTIQSPHTRHSLARDTTSVAARRIRGALALALLAAITPIAHGAAPEDAPRRESLQRFLARLRQDRTGLLTSMKSSVDAALRTLETEAQTKRPQGLEDAQTRLVALGVESAPLLVEHIDPGEKADDTAKLRAAHVASALARMPTRAITAQLLSLARTGSAEGRANALCVLGASPDVEQVLPVLTTIYRTETGALKLQALTAIAKIGGPDSEHVIRDALEARDAETVKVALGAVAASRSVAVAPLVLGLLDSPQSATPFVDGVLAYYKACPEVVDKEHLLALVRVAQEFSVAKELRVRVLEAIATFADRADADVRRNLRQVAEAPAREVREAALVACYALGDKGARKELVSDYDAQIERNKNWANSYEARGNVLYRLGEYRDALKDFQKALQLSAGDLRARPDDSYVGLARCYMQLGRSKDAAQALERSTLSNQRRAELAREPLFEKLARDPKYRAVFGIR